ncbi:unnamed protein product [Cyprideis torosa]|uniref:Eukaryotic translation initiation factor 2 subunit 1 n=1 Tax=Cyprideis torosa TaxID=163714 RepID=A0A7R8ZPA5_9CRUS|nr:unnamed protein product [Cyprideis torosa]CAG0898357.1 unnamed protein product [Cyprideis torosa]
MDWGQGGGKEGAAGAVPSRGQDHSSSYQRRGLDSLPGMILLSELSRRRIRSISKIIRIGKVEPVVVIRVDKEKASIRGPYQIGDNKPKDALKENAFLSGY